MYSWRWRRTADRDLQGVNLTAGHHVADLICYKVTGLLVKLDVSVVGDRDTPGIQVDLPGDTRRWINVGLTLVQVRCTNGKPILIQRLVSAALGPRSSGQREPSTCIRWSSSLGISALVIIVQRGGGIILFFKMFLANLLMNYNIKGEWLFARLSI